MGLFTCLFISYRICRVCYYFICRHNRLLPPPPRPLLGARNRAQKGGGGGVKWEVQAFIVRVGLLTSDEAYARATNFAQLPTPVVPAM